jgi:hypothetical protein
VSSVTLKSQALGTNRRCNSDEADVFLESRGKGPGSNTERNALVSGKQVQNELDLKSTTDQHSISPGTRILQR